MSQHDDGTDPGTVPRAAGSSVQGAKAPERLGAPAPDLSLLARRANLLLHRRWLVLGLALCFAAYALALNLARLPAATGVEASAHEFSAARALALIERLIADAGPHPVGTPANAVVRDRIVAELEGMGYDVEIQAAFGCRVQWSLCGHIENIIAVLPASTQPGSAQSGTVPAGSGSVPSVMLTAHYDSVGAGPGVSDDMAGVAAVLEVARILRQGPPLRNSVVFLISDGEEAGLLGAEAFVKHPLAAQVAAVVNLEARGTSGPSMLFETSSGNARLIEAFAAVAPRPVTNSLLYELYQLLPNDTDFSVYKEAGMAGVNFAYVDDVARYHTALDDVAHLDLGSLQHHGDNALAATIALAGLDPAEFFADELVYADVAPGVVLRWPGGVAPWLAAVSLLVWLLIGAVVVRARLAGWGRIVLGALLVMLALAAAGAAGWLVSLGLVRLAGVPQPWYADPGPTRAVIWAAGLLVFIACLWPVARRLGAWSLSVAVWLLWSVLAVASALLLTGGSVYFQLPLAVATGLFALVAFGGMARIRVVVGLAVLISAAATAYVWLPFAVAVEGGLGFELAPALALIVALGLSPLAATLAQRRRPPGVSSVPVVTWVAALAALVIVGGGALVVSADPYSESHPQRLTIEHLHVQGAEPVWLLRTSYAQEYEAKLLPGGLLTAGGFGRGRISAPPYLDRSVPYAPAPTATAGLPEIELLGVVLTPGVTTVRVRLDIPGGADLLELDYRGPGGMSSITFAGSDYQLAPVNPRVLGDTIHCHGRACAGMEVEFVYSGEGPLNLSLAAIDYGLPPAGAALLAARPADATPSHRGDLSVRLTRLEVGE